MRPMKNLFLSTIAILSLSIIPVQAQEYEGCFALDGQGNYVDLSYLCNYPEETIPPTTTETPTAAPTTSQFSNDEIYEASYYSGFCSAIAEGKTVEEAKDAGLYLAALRLQYLGDESEPSNAAILTSVRIDNGEIPCPD